MMVRTSQSAFIFASEVYSQGVSKSIRRSCLREVVMRIRRRSERGSQDCVDRFSRGRYARCGVPVRQIFRLVLSLLSGSCCQQWAVFQALLNSHLGCCTHWLQAFCSWQSNSFAFARNFATAGIVGSPVLARASFTNLPAVG